MTSLGPKLKGGFIQIAPGVQNPTSWCLFCCSPICLPLSLPSSILGWLLYPISMNCWDPDQPLSSKSQCAAFCMCYHYRWAPCTIAILCCPLIDMDANGETRFANNRLAPAFALPTTPTHPIAHRLTPYNKFVAIIHQNSELGRSGCQEWVRLELRLS